MNILFNSLLFNPRISHKESLFYDYFWLVGLPLNSFPAAIVAVGPACHLIHCFASLARVHEKTPTNKSMKYNIEVSGIIIH